MTLEKKILEEKGEKLTKTKSNLIKSGNVLNGFLEFSGITTIAFLKMLATVSESLCLNISHIIYTYQMVLIIFK